MHALVYSVWHNLLAPSIVTVHTNPRVKTFRAQVTHAARLAELLLAVRFSWLITLTNVLYFKLYMNFYEIFDMVTSAATGGFPHSDIATCGMFCSHGVA